MNQHKLVAFVLTSILFLPLLSCGGHDADEKYFLISANIKIPYWEMAGAGLSQAASDLKVRSKFDGPDGYDPKAEQDALQKAIQQKATGILISVVDTATKIIGNEKNEKIDAFVCVEARSQKDIATVINNNRVKGKVVMAMDTDQDTLEWIQKGVITVAISQKPYTMSYVGLKMLDDLYHHKLGNLNADWSKDVFAPIPAFVDTGSSLVDKSNVDAFIQAQKSMTSTRK